MSSSERSLMATTSMPVSGRVAMILNTARPMRPNPLIATRVTLASPAGASLLGRLPRRLGASSPIRC